MDASRKAALKKYHQELRCGLILRNFLPVLQKLLTDVEYSKIKDCEDNIATVDALIEILLTKENWHFEEFCTILRKNGYEHWAKTLQDEADQKEGLITLDIIDVDSTVGAHGQCKLHRRSIRVNINAITKMFRRGGRLIHNLEGFGTEVIIISQKVLQVDNEEIKRLYQVDEALHHLKSVAEIAYTFLDRVNDVIYYCQGDSMAAAKRGLSSSPPDLKPLRDLMRLLENSLKKTGNSYVELMGASDKAICSCDEAAQVCQGKEKELQKKKGAARGIGGTAAGALMVASGGAVAGGVAASIVAGVFTFGIGAVVGLGLTAAAGFGLGAVGVAAGAGTAAVTHFIADHYKKGEASFRNIRDGFKALLDFARNLKEEVAQVHTIQGNLAAQVDNIELSLAVEDITLIKDTLERLNMVCTDSYDITSKCRDQVKSKMDELNDRIK